MFAHPAPTGRIAAYLADKAKIENRFAKLREWYRKRIGDPGSLPFRKHLKRSLDELEREHFPRLIFGHLHSVNDLPALWRWLEHELPSLELRLESRERAKEFFGYEPRPFYTLLEECLVKLRKLGQRGFLEQPDQGMSEKSALAALLTLQLDIQLADGPVLTATSLPPLAPVVLSLAQLERFYNLERGYKDLAAKLLKDGKILKYERVDRQKHKVVLASPEEHARLAQFVADETGKRKKRGRKPRDKVS